MDPLSIVAGCVGIVGTIAKSSMTIRAFVRDVREARRELGATARYLAELEMTINLIKDDYTPRDEKSEERQIPESITAHTQTVIGSCHDLLAELDALMEKHSPRRQTAPLVWALKGKDDVSALNRQIEAHTRTLAIALEVSTLFVSPEESNWYFFANDRYSAVVKTVKTDTSQIKEDTTQLRQDTEQILSEMSRLRMGFALQPLGDQVHQGRIHIIERYLDSLTTYAGSVVDMIDDGDEASLRTASPPPGNEMVRVPPSQGSSPTPTLREANVEFDTSGGPQNLDHQPELNDRVDVGPTQSEVPWWEDGIPSTTKDDRDDPMAVRPVSLSTTSQITLPIQPQVSEELSPLQPSNAGPLLDDSPISVLVIGPRGHGKTSFIRRLMHLPGQPTGNVAQQTKDPVVLGPFTVYEAEVSTSGYHLVDKETGKIKAVYDFPPTVQHLTHATFRIGLSNPNAKRVKLRLVESRFDYSLAGMPMVESMNNLLATLRKLPADLNESWNGAFDAVALVHEVGPEISADCQRGFRYFQTAMPEPFTRVSAVNTHTNLGLAEVTLKRIRQARTTELGSLFMALNNEQSHIFMDNAPSAGTLRAEYLGCREIPKLLSLWSGQKGLVPLPRMRTPEMRLLKTPEMQEVDLLMARALGIAVERWKAQVLHLHERCAKTEEEIANTEVDLKDHIRLLSEVEADIAKYDTEEKVWLSTYSVGQSTPLVRTTQRMFSRKKPQIRITEPYDNFGVDWNWGDGSATTGARWLDDAEYDIATRTWKRGYQIDVQEARLLAKSFVIKRVRYGEELQKWRTQRTAFMSGIPQLRKRVLEKKSQLRSFRKEEDVLETYKERIQVVSSWEKGLASKELPIGKTFSDEERKRYAKSASDLQFVDLYAFMQAFERGRLVGTLRKVLGNPRNAGRTPMQVSLRAIEADQRSAAAISKNPLTY